MRPECRQAINSAAGKVLSDAELNRLEEDIIHHYHQTQQELSRAERYRLAGEKAQEARIKETAEALHTHIDEAYKQHTLLSDIANVQAGVYGKSQAFFNKLFHRAGSSEVPLEKKIEAHSTHLLAPFSRYAEEGSKNLGFTLDKQFGLDVFDEMLGKKTQNGHASRLVKQYQQTMKELHVQAREAGIGFKFRENRIPQPMSVDKLYTTKKSDFIQSMFDLVDRSKYKNVDGSLYSDAQMVSLFGDVFEERISSKGQSTHSPFSPKVGKKRDFERVFHFKDGLAHMEFMDKFGVSSNVNEILTSDIKSLSKDIVIARELGANADTFVKQTIEKLISEDVVASSGSKDIKDKLGRNRLDVLKAQMLNMWDVMQYGETVENAVWANRMSGARSLAGASMLGQHPLGALLEDGFISGQMLSRIGIDKEAIQHITKMSVKERMEVLSDVGLFAEGVVAHGRNLMDAGDTSQLAHNVHSKMHKWSGAEYLDKRRTSSHALIVYNQIGRMVDKYASLKDLLSDSHLDSKVKLFFKQLNDVDFAVIKKAKPLSSPDGDLSARTPSTIKSIADVDLHDLVDKLGAEKTSYHQEKLRQNSKTKAKLSEAESQEIQQQLKELRSRESNVLKDKVSTKLNALVLDNLQTSVRGAMRSSLYDRQRLGLLTYKRGTIAGEALRMFQQFTTTPTGMFLNTLDLYNSSKMPKGASMALDYVKTQYIATMVLAGIGIAGIKALIRGEDPSLSGVITDGLCNNGALLPYVDRLYKLATKGDMASAGGLIGAVPSAVTGLTSSVFDLAMKQNEASLVKTAKSIRKTVPFMNMWYIKNSFDHLILNQILEELNPGYLAKQQSKKEKHGVGLFQNMDEVVPHRLPYPLGED
ncbi:hypothetical protein DJ66_1179 [Candidatus Liberibacter solanacearum]|uniref:Uncharacterized protein n=1 Tax=Candidatus Liberibacter solanacearum TaxID=556287 RepID=A0A0F4VJ72_9HYPH|nr:hypothetical protein [Candidatus Liberibacter solanacearum]KJZ81501.1 hypothetical protein DJ66_1179 [Candidatus Liberibacter solanacearum]